VHRLPGTLQRLAGLHADAERPHAPPFPDPELTLALARLVGEENPDVVHAHNWIYASFLPVKMRTGVPFVVSLHDYGLVCPKKNFMHQGTELCEGPKLAKCLSCATGHYGPVKAVVTTFAARASGLFARSLVDRFVPVSRAVARHNDLDRADARRKGNYEVIPNFVPDDVGVPGPEDDCLSRLPKGEFILFVGDMMRLKGIDVLLKAYSALERAPPLVMIGRRTASTPDVMPPNVHAMGTWPHPAIMHAWRRSLFGVLPSTGPEACATVIVEAMASGRTVVASDIGGMPDLVDDGDTGLLVRPGDVHGLRWAMQRLLDDRALLARLSDTALARVGRLQAGSVVPRIEQVYRDVVHEVSRSTMASAPQRQASASGGPRCP
jgi:glycosyltransferase involved in cell wall biosynthesis